MVEALSISLLVPAADAVTATMHYMCRKLCCRPQGVLERWSQLWLDTEYVAYTAAAIRESAIPRRRRWLGSLCTCALLLVVRAPPAVGWLLAVVFQASSAKRAWARRSITAARDELALMMLVSWALFCVVPASVAWGQVRRGAYKNARAY